MYENNKIPMCNATPYMTFDVSVQSEGLNAGIHGHCKYRGLKKHIILIIKWNHSVRVFLKNKCLGRMQQIPTKTGTMVWTFKNMSTIVDSFCEAS